MSMVWLGTVPPIPTCETCGATMKEPHGPVIEMERNKYRWYPNSHYDSNIADRFFYELHEKKRLESYKTQKNR